MQTIQCKDMTFTWLDSTVSVKDGGPTFGPVVKAVWSQRYPCDQNYNIQSQFSPILLQYQGLNYLIDSGMNTSKFSDKKIRNLGIKQTNQLEASLSSLGLSTQDIHGVMMTHMHDDHASGLTKLEDNQFVSVFPNAKIYINQIEWDNVRNPSLRMKGTYLEENWQPIQDQVITFTDSIKVADQIEMIHVGGHTEGLSVIRMTQDDQVYFHFSDLQQNVANLTNPLWVSAFDDYPMDSIKARQHWLPIIMEKQYHLIFYHDPYYFMVQLNHEGQVINYLKRETHHYIPWPEEVTAPHEKINK